MFRVSLDFFRLDLFCSRNPPLRPSFVSLPGLTPLSAEEESRFSCFQPSTLFFIPLDHETVKSCKNKMILRTNNMRVYIHRIKGKKSLSATSTALLFYS